MGEGKYDRLPDLAAELVHLKVDVLVTFGTPGTLAAKQTTTTIPIVMAGSGDAIATGLVFSLARPGGNITGSTLFIPELMAKRLELLKEAMPRTRRVAVLINPDNSANVPVLKDPEAPTGRGAVAMQPRPCSIQICPAPPMRDAGRQADVARGLSLVRHCVLGPLEGPDALRALSFADGTRFPIASRSSTPPWPGQKFLRQSA